MDLYTQYPRSIKVQLGPYVHLPRIIDKCRAKLADRLGEYLYPCPLDICFLEFTGISSERFLDAVRTRTDQAMLEWLTQQATVRTHNDILEWNTMMLNRGPDSEAKWSYFLEVRNSIDPHRQDITSWSDLLDLDEAREVPFRKTPLL